MIIYPPLISDIVPGFIIQDEKAIIKIPFEQNPGVPITQVKAMKIQIKDYLSSTIIQPDLNAYDDTEKSNYTDIIFASTNIVEEDGKYVIIFEIPKFYYKINGLPEENNSYYTFPQVNLSYKLQIAYCDDSDVIIENDIITSIETNSNLIFSSASLGKCVKPASYVYITGEKGVEHRLNNEVFALQRTYTGVYGYQQNEEPLYSYQFNLYSTRQNNNEEFIKDQLIETSGEKNWNSKNNTSSRNLLDVKNVLFRGEELRLELKQNNVTLAIAECSLSPLDGSMQIKSYNYEFKPNTSQKNQLGRYDLNQYVQENILEKNNDYFIGYSSTLFNKSDSFGPLFKYVTNNNTTHYVSAVTYNDNIKTLQTGIQIYLTQLSAKNENDEWIPTISSVFVQLEKNTKFTFFEPYGVEELAKPTYTLNTNLNSNNRYIIEFIATTTSGRKIIDSRLVYNLNSVAPHTQYRNTTINKISNDNNTGIQNLEISFLNSQVLSLKNSNIVLDRQNLITGERIEIASFKPSTMTHIVQDFSAEQGIPYKYILLEYTQNFVYSTPIVESVLTFNFEDMFLSDKNHQLKIKFDPKVSSFKTTLLESKTDTIGGKYPYFFRNGQVGYKEIPIAGLISYQMDDNQFFMTDAELGLDQETLIRTTNLEDYNIAAERIFKLKVLDWLNNGKPKLFRSPTEGNYVVRLMNISLSPNDTLGRMLHSFSCTGYECAAADPKTLQELDLVFIPPDQEVIIDE